jgi:heme exporter protein B
MRRRSSDPEGDEPRPPGLRGATRVLLERELDLAWSGGGGPLLACGFFGCLTAILPLAVGGDPRTLGPVAGGVAWLALALASLLSLERLFERDFEDNGSPSACRWP